MPNLRDFAYYNQKAIDAAGRLSVGTNVIVYAVHTNASQPGLFLVGTDAEPIRVEGPVVVPGDVVIKGKITGIGTLYVGGNLYIAGDMTYRNGPDFSTPPDTMPAADRDRWVRDNAGKDLVAFAVRESIFAGDPNSADWTTWCFDNAEYGLKGVGDESQLGADGIAHTGDDGQAYLDTNNDGHPDSAWFDADGDGTVDHNFNYNNDIKMSNTRAARIAGFPEASPGVKADYSTEASNNMNRLDGIFYTNHAAAMRLDRASSVFNGAIICRNEAIVFRTSAQFVYDDRIHSRYSNDPNRFVDLGLPVAGLVKVASFTELAPIHGFCPAL
jgi:hypothetical protein